MTQRIALINPDGTLDIGGVRCKVVPEEPTKEMLMAGDNSAIEGYHGDYLIASDCYAAMLSAAAIDLSGLPVVPARRVSMDINGKNGWAQWNAALDAIGVKP